MRLAVLSLFSVGLLLGPGPAVAAETSIGLASSWGETDQGRVRLLVAAAPTGAAAAALSGGLEFDLQPHWKIYWRAPGDAGLPPEVDWQGSVNATPARFDWPVPQRFSFSGLETFGYEGQVILPFAITRDDARQPGHLAARD